MSIVAMSRTLEPDLCVVGAGAAGLSVAAVAASFGASVVLIEKGRMGGECLNTGCVPSKALLAAAAAAQARRTSGRFGIAPGEPEVDPVAVRDHVRAVIAAIAPNDSPERFAAMGVTVLREHARFVDGRTMKAGDTTVTARRFVLATGSSPLVPPVPGLAEAPFLTNETVFDLAERPSRLAVIGGGPIGMELAQAHARLGAPVTVLSASPVLPREDREVADIVAAALRGEGAVLRENVVVRRVETTPDGLRIVFAAAADAPDETLDASHLLVAAGRKPTVADLGLDAAGVVHGETGIAVDARLRTSNRRIFALGDCATGGTGDLRFTHAASHQASLVVRNALFRVPGRLDLAAIPRVTYTDPEVASVGLSEEEAFRSDRRARILRWPLAETDRAQAERTTVGLIKAVVAGNGRVLGCTIVAPHAGELVAPWALAITKRMKAQDLAGLVMPYPTYSELTKRAAVEHLRPLADSALVRGWLRFARRLG